MRHERCEVQINRQGEPISVHWNGQDYPVNKILRTYCTGGTGGLSLREHWIVDGGFATMHVYSVEYGSAGFRKEKWWWLGAIDPDPRGFMTVY